MNKTHALDAKRLADEMEAKRQPDPSPAQREERLVLSESGFLCASNPPRDVALMLLTPGWTDQSRADAQRLVNGWNALPLVERAEKALEEHSEATRMYLAAYYNFLSLRFEYEEHSTDELAHAVSEASCRQSDAEERLTKAGVASEVALTAIRESKEK